MTALPRSAGVLFVLLLVLAGEARADSAIFGEVKGQEGYGTTPASLQDVSVTATSPSLPGGERRGRTDTKGAYLLEGLPPGVYTLRYEYNTGILSHVRSGVVLGEAQRLRVDVWLDLAPMRTRTEEYGPCEHTPIDPERPELGAQLHHPRACRVEERQPSGLDEGVRSAEHVVQWVPGIRPTAGLSIHDASPYENAYLLDGLSTRDPVTGLNALPVRTELLSSAEVITGGATPEHGLATGGLLQAETAGVSRLAFEGSFFGYGTPGLLEGGRETGVSASLGDFGATISGPLSGPLAFFLGIAPVIGRGQRGVQTLGKLAYFINATNHVSLSVLSALDSLRGDAAGAEPWRRDRDTTRVMVRHAGLYANRELSLEARAGWLRQRVSRQGDADATPWTGGVDSFQGSVRAAPHFRALRVLGLGYHSLVMGVDAEHSVYERRAPAPRSSSSVLGAHVKSHWDLPGRLRVQGGVRYDVQVLEPDEAGQGSITLPVLSPSVGLTLLPLRRDALKLFAWYTKYAGRVPLGLLDGDTGLARVDPDLRPMSTRELAAGTHLEVTRELSVGASYTHRTLSTGLASVRDADGNAVLVNPGSGLGSALPVAERTYGAVSVQLRCDCHDDGVVAYVSYTGSRLRGNHEGPWRAPAPEADSVPLPEDQPHVLRFQVSRGLWLAGGVWAGFGLAWLGSAGTPVAGRDSRTPWVHSVDGHLFADWKLPSRDVLSFSLDAFNVFNFQAATQQDARDGALVPVRHQPPRQVRLGVRYSY